MPVNQLQLPGRREKRSAMDTILQGLQIANEVFKIPVGISSMRQKSAEADVAERKARGEMTTAEYSAEGYEKVDPAKLAPKPQMVPYAPDYQGPRPMLPPEYYGPKPSLIPVVEQGSVQLTPSIKTDAKQKFFDKESELTTEWQKHAVTADTTKSLIAANKLLNTLSKPGSGARDISATYTFLHAIEPGSAVKQGEFDSVANASGLFDKMRMLDKNLKEGRFIGENGRKQIAAAVLDIIESQKQIQSVVDDQYRDKARERGFNPARVVKPFWTDIGEDGVGVPNEESQQKAIGGAHTDLVGGSFEDPGKQKRFERFMETNPIKGKKKGKE